MTICILKSWRCSSTHVGIILDARVATLIRVSSIITYGVSSFQSGLNALGLKWCFSGMELSRSLFPLLSSSEAQPRPSTTWITFRKAVLSFCLPLSLKIASRVSEQEQLRFTNNDEACHASFTIHHPGAVPGRWSVLHKNQLSVKYTSLQCLLLWSSSEALYSKSRLRCDITVYHCPARWGLHWEWVQCTPDEVSKLSYVRIWLLYGDSFCFLNTES